MKLVVGLGNPGEKYKNNRHNVGYMVIDALASKIPSSKHQISNKSKILRQSRLLIFKSKNFMNESGSFVKHLISQYPNISISDLYIVHDDLDIPLGSYKIQFGKGPKVHRGIQSIEQALDTPDFWRVRVGIENRTMNDEQRTKGEEYVLQNFTNDEMEKLEKVVKTIANDKRIF